MSVPVLVALLALVAAVRRLHRTSRSRRAKDRQRAAELELLRSLSAELLAGAAPLAAWRTVVDELEIRGGGGGDRVGGRGAGRGGAVAGSAAVLVRVAACEAEGEAADLLRSAESEAMRAVGAAWRVSAGTGAPLAVSLDRLASAATDAAATARTVRATLAGPRMTARLLALLPVAGLGLAALSGTNPLAILLGTPAGRLCLVVGVLLDVAGLLWIERLADAAEP